MSWFRDAVSFVQAGSNVLRELTPVGMLGRGAAAVAEVAREHFDDKVDVAVIGRGGAYDPGNLWNLYNDRADHVVYEPGSAGAAVDGILRKAEGKTLRTLTINAHGAPGKQTIGHDIFAQIAGGEASFSPRLSELKRVMDEDTVVVLRGCNVGEGERGEQLLRALSEMWGVEVRAGETLQWPMGEGLEGPVLSCKPDADGKAQCRRAFSEFSLAW